MYRAGMIRRGSFAVCRIQHGLVTATCPTTIPFFYKVPHKTYKLLPVYGNSAQNTGEKINVKKFMFDDTDNVIASNSPLQIIVDLLNQLAAETKANQTATLKSSKFTELMEHLKCDFKQLPVAELVNCLKNLRALYPEEDPDVMIAMDEHIQSMISKVPVPQLGELIWSHMHNDVTQQRQQTFQATKAELLGRLSEINDPKILVSMLWIADEKSLEILESKMVGIVDHLNLKQIYRMLRFLSYHKRRNTLLIRSLVNNFNFRCSGTTLKLTLPHLLALAESCACLNIYNEALLEHWSKAVCLLLENPTTKASVNNICSCSRSIRQLRWHDRTLIDLLVRRMMISYETGTLSHNLLCDMLIMCGTVNYMPMELRKSLPQICSCFTEEFRMKNSRSFVEIMWSLACVGALRDSRLQLDGIVESPVIDHLKASSPEQVFSSLCVKLMNISTELSSKMPENVPAANHIKVPVTKQQPLVSRAVAALSNMYPAEKFINFNIQDPLGYIIDIEMLVNSDGKPQPLNSNDQNLKKLAVKILGYSDMTLNEVGPIGRHCMMERHLQHAGYKVIMVPYSELVGIDTAVKYVKYLEFKLGIKQSRKEHL